MDLRTEQLRRFVVLAEELNFTHAARRLSITQQVLSAQVRTLEQSLGVQLLNRTTRRVALTPAGATFLDHAVSVLRAADEPPTRRCGRRGTPDTGSSS